MINDIKNKRFGRLEVLEITNEKTSNGCYKWKCKCDCGNIIITNGASLRRGKKNSCGCLMIEHQKTQYYKHGHTGERMFNIWRKIKSRCLSKNCVDYKNYGGRGITICNEWLDFINFYNWSTKNGYSDILEIDRINNDGNYEPNNCRWVDRYIQANNKRNNCYYKYDGYIYTIAELSRKYNIDYKVLHSRLTYLKWNIDRAINEKIYIGKNQYTNNK